MQESEKAPPVLDPSNRYLHGESTPAPCRMRGEYEHMAMKYVWLQGEYDIAFAVFYVTFGLQ